MRALILEQPGRVALQNVPIPTPGPGEVLVRVESATTCGTDLKAWVRGHPQIPMPGVFGHEYSGVVEAVGEGTSFLQGDPVMGVHSAPCQSCFWCLRDQENLCESIMSSKVLGSFAEYLLVPERIARLNLFRKPDSISFDAASLLEPLACVTQGVSLLPLEHHPRVLVIGPGAIGLMFVAVLKAHDIEDIVLAGRSPLRLAVGAKLGAQTVKLSELSDKAFDIVIECTGQPEVWESSIQYVRRGGTLMLFGGPPGGTRVSFDTHRLHYDQITLLSPFHFGTVAVRAARELLLNRDFDLSSLISGERRLEDATAVFEDLRAGNGIKYVFKPSHD